MTKGLISRQLIDPHNTTEHAVACERLWHASIEYACVSYVQHALDQGSLSSDRLEGQDLKYARPLVAGMVGWRKRVAAGCESLVREALALLAPLHVLILEDEPWAIVQAVANGSRSFRWPSRLDRKHMAFDKAQWRVPTSKYRITATSKYRLAQYLNANGTTVIDAQTENACASELMARVRARAERQRVSR